MEVERAGSRDGAAPSGEGLAWLGGGGEMGARMRAFDWASTALGPAASWPQSLRTTVSTCLSSRFPILIWWGSELVKLYNDPYAAILGAKHPAALGRPGREVWPEIWDTIGPMLDGVMARGEATWSENILLPLERLGFAEECYFTFSYSPIRTEDGAIGGVFSAIAETTAQVLSERRLRTLRDLAEKPGACGSVAEVLAAARDVLAANPADLPFAVMYAAGQPDAVLAVGVASPPPATDVASLLAHAGPVAVAELERALGGALAIAAPRPERAVVLPIVRGGDASRAGALVIGLSPRLVADARYLDFLALIGKQLGAAVDAVVALEETRRRAEALAELDRAKTAFFSNVSHEFRTPLALMLGPTEDALAAGAPLAGDALALAHRSQLRLLKLVNSLLDFARIEAGRAEAAFRATDLAAFTADLASQFRAALERAGLRLEIDMPPLPAPVFVDHEMWEKIVLNLLSNAFKHTFEGAIGVSLAPVDGAVQLVVRDTGVGIPADELPRIFDRFHRVKEVRARSHEGTGIGLALVRDLVKLHGGSVEVESTVGRGTTFTVTLPTGSAHLAAERIAAPRGLESTAIRANAFLGEAFGWLDRDEPAAPAMRATPARILLVDDNADMRAYLHRLLSASWTVRVVSDGEAALASIQADPPDLVVSDVMMPGLDGLELTRALRADPSTATIPIVLLSARAGEEAAAEGLAAGASDYVVKPFSARELRARVEAQLAIARAQVLAEDATERERERLASLLMTLPAAVAVLRGPKLVYELANERYCELVGKHDLVGWPGRVALPELGPQGVWDVIEGVYRTGEPFVAHEYGVRLARGEEGELEQGYFDWSAQATRGPDGAIDGILIFAIDVTESVLARRELEQARGTEAELRRVAEGANRAKDEFLAMLGHELRNPLAPIASALGLLELRGGPAIAREREVIERQVQHLARLVDDLLDVARIARGNVALERRRLEIAGVVGRAIEMASPLIEQRRHRLTVDVARAGLAVDGDPARLAQVVANLLTNAAKYTPSGGDIQLSAAREGAHVVLRVRDTGVGIAPEVLPHVFERFVQERQTIDRAQGGLGLGLTIVRSLVIAHGGEVVARSAGAGTGTEMVVRLPAAAAPVERPAPRRAAARRAEGCHRVLVVDDNADAADLLAELLGAVGHDSRVVYDAAGALRAFEEFEPEIALVDLGLPVMDGYELAERLRAADDRHALRLVAVTGYGQDSDRARARAAGFDAHLVKPVAIERVVALIDELAGGG